MDRTLPRDAVPLDFRHSACRAGAFLALGPRGFRGPAPANYAISCERCNGGIVVKRHSMDFLSVPLVLIVVIVFYLISSIKILAEYERAVIFRLGRVRSQPKGPGVILVFVPLDRIVRVSLRVEAMEVPAQDVVTRDNVTVKVNAVIYFRIVDPNKAVLEVANYLYATSQLAQT